MRVVRRRILNPSTHEGHCSFNDDHNLLSRGFSKIVFCFDFKEMYTLCAICVSIFHSTIKMSVIATKSRFFLLQGSINLYTDIHPNHFTGLAMNAYQTDRVTLEFIILVWFNMEFIIIIVILSDI